MCDVTLRNVFFATIDIKIASWNKDEEVREDLRKNIEQGERDEPGMSKSASPHPGSEMMESPREEEPQKKGQEEMPLSSVRKI